MITSFDKSNSAVIEGMTISPLKISLRVKTLCILKRQPISDEIMYTI